MLFSVIVPVFKVEKYIHEAVNSVLGQGFGDFEVILVDDGSPDGCPQICDAYARQDNRVRVLHQPNGGLSAARNSGICASCGEYLVFLDSDDRMAPHALEILARGLAGAKRPDVLCAKYVELSGPDNRLVDCGYSLKPMAGYHLDDVLKALFTEIPNYGLQVWKYIFRRELVVSGNLWFDTALFGIEDAHWLFQVLLAAQSFGSVDEPIYCYRVDNQGSIVHSGASMRRFAGAYFVYTHWFAYFSAYEGAARAGVLGRLADGYVNCAKWIHGLPAGERRKAVEMFKAHREICAASHVRANRLLLPLMKVFGVVFYSWSLACLHALVDLLKRMRHGR